MVEATNTTWESAEHSLFVTHYAACLAIHDYSGNSLDANQSLQVVRALTNGPETGILKVSLETDESCDLTECTAVVEAEDELGAARKFSQTLIQSLIEADKDPECLEFVELHLVPQAQLEEDIARAKADADEDGGNKDSDYTLSIHSEAYEVQELPVHDIDEASLGTLHDEGHLLTETDLKDYNPDLLYSFPHIEAAAVFYQARDALAYGE